MFCNLRRSFCYAVFSLCIAGTAVEAQNAVPRIARPNPELAPGVTNPDITQANITQNICKKGWSTKSIRPRSSYTSGLKRTQLAAYGDTKRNILPSVATKNGRGMRPDITKCVTRSSNPACYEEDHLISLELGGHPTNPANLWPEPWFGPWNARVKDRLENKLHQMVCDGSLSLKDAQKAVATDWVAAFRLYIPAR